MSSTVHTDLAGAAPAGWRRVGADELLPLGAHLMTPRRGFTHHGIHVGGGWVVHYAGLSRTLFRGPVERVSVARFAGGQPMFVRQGGRCTFTPDDIVRRAMSRLGEDCYRIATNNCEHFCEWCRSGENRSAQVDRLVGPLRAVVRLLDRFIGGETSLPGLSGSGLA